MFFHSVSVSGVKQGRRGREEEQNGRRGTGTSPFPVYSPLFRLRLASVHSRPQRPRQESRPLAGTDFLSIPREFVSYSQPIRFVRPDYAYAQSDGKFVNRGLPVLDQARGRHFLVLTKRSVASGNENSIFYKL